MAAHIPGLSTFRFLGTVWRCILQEMLDFQVPPSIYDDLWHGTYTLNLGLKTIKEVSTNSEIYNI